LIQQCKVPLVLDAEALNILAENKTWLSFLPTVSILTPHPKEFERLCGKWSNSFERLQMQKDFSLKYNCYVVFKGAYTCISTPLGNCYFNPTGNAGMAKGGSGDVLTGILTSLLAQQMEPAEACILGVYIHGLAGDLALLNEGERSMLPEDLIANLGKAFMKVQSNL
jgi:NAD(P)H-hydrate epimerase